MRVTGLVVCLVALAGCSRRSAPVPEVPAPAPPRTLEEVMRRTQLAFWPKGDAFEAKQPTYLAEVDPRGVRFKAASDGATAVSFGPAQLTRGDWRAESAPAPWQRLDDGSLWRGGPGHAERLENTDEGLEQSWRFEAAPPGDGALVVRVAVTGASRVEQRPSGLHFAHRGGFVRYGHGTWIDATGARTAVPVRFAEGTATLEVPGALLAQSQYPAVLDPLLSPEQDVDLPTPVPVYSTQDEAAGASNGALTLATWIDRRIPSTPHPYAARIDQDGQVLDGFAFPLGFASSQGDSAPVSVASDGNEFFAVMGTQAGLWAVRVSAAGEVRDAPPLQLTDAPSSATAIAWTGSHYVVVAIEWSVDGNGTWIADNLVALTVLPSGVVTSRANLTSRGSESSVPGLARPLLAWSGSMLLVAYADASDVVARRLLPDLSLLDAAPIPLFSGVSEFRLAWDGQRFLATALSSGIIGVRVTTTGAVIDNPPFRVMSGGATTHGTAGDDAGVGIAWTESRGGVVGLYAARVTPAGAIANVTATSLAVSPPGPALCRLVTTRDGFVALWQANAQLSNVDIFGARLSRSLTGLDAGTFRVSSSAARQDSVDVAWNGSSYLAAWVDSRVSSTSLFTTRLARDGTPLAPLATLGAFNSGTISRVSVASNGEDWLVAWQQPGSDQDIFGSRVAADGTWMTDGGMPIVSRLGAQQSPDIAWLGGRYVVVFSDGSGAITDISAIPVSADGTVIASAAFVVNDSQGDQVLPRIAPSDGGALVVWLDRRDGGAQNIFAARLLESGQVLDPQGFRIADHNGTKNGPAVAAGEGGYLVCWEDRRTSALRPFAARVSPTLGLLDDAGIALSARANHSPIGCAPAWDGEHYFVGWASASTSALPTAPDAVELRGTWVDVGGRVVDGGLADGGDWVWAAAASRLGLRNVAVGSPGHRQVLLAYTVETATDGGGIARVRTRTLTRGVAPVASGGVATTPEEAPVEVPLSATDGDGDAVTFVVVRAPLNGAATALDGSVRYAPARDFHGEERFTVAADDGALLSPPVEVVITVTPVDDAPVAPPLSATTDEDQPVELVVPSRDADDAGLTLVVVQAPAHGALAGAPPTLTYTPAADFSGSDSFSYALSDGVTASAPASAQLVVRAVPDAPVAVASAWDTEEDTSLEVLLSGSDVDGDALSFEVVEGPLHGTLEGAAPALRYVPAQDFSGEDRIVFRVSDGALTAMATAQLAVRPVNDAPSARSVTVAARAGQPVSITLDARDVDGDALTFSVREGPSSGTLEGEAPALVYTPLVTFEGEDSLTFEVVDPAGAASTGVVRFEVTGAQVVAPPPPPASCGCAAGDGGLGVGLALLGLWRRRARRA